jgi:pimeloyl-ACP methyl ester carboxylesterase
MSERPVLIATEGGQLVADLGPGGPEAVVLLPGWSGTRFGPQRILWQTAQGLRAAGYTTLRLDFLGRGDSEGDATAVTLDGMIADTAVAIAWLRAHAGVSRVHLVGLCSGGNVALGAASCLPEIGHVVCWSLLPFMEHKAQAAKQGTPRRHLLRQLVKKLTSPEAWRKLLRGEANVKGAVATLAKDKEGDTEERGRKTSQRDILADLGKTWRGPLHLLYGSRDPESAGSEAFFTAWCGRQRLPVDIRTIAGAPHNFFTAAWTREVVTQTVAWLQEQAPPPPPR